MIKKILIVQTAFIGDVILITPLIRETKKIFPQAQIDVLVAKGNQTILENNPYINQIITSDKKSISDYFKCLFMLFRNKYDLALTPHRSARSLSLIFLAGIKVRIGFNRDIFRHLLTCKMRHPQKVHKAKKNLELLSPFISDKFPKLQVSDYHLTYDDLDWSSELFPSETDCQASSQYLKTKKNVAIAPGSVWNTKRWSKENYIKLVKKLSKHGFNLIFIGSKGEKDLAQEIINQANIEAYNTCGDLSILESAGLIAQCHALICNDSGALHIGNAVATPVFAFFGPTVKRFGYFPYRENDYLFEIDLECRPCGMHGHKQCPLGHHKCMKLIDVDFVFKKIYDYLT
jgi:heptosyltransferase-2